MVTAKDGVCLRALLFSAASWSHLSPVQEALLLWQPHTCNERASATHTHSCAHSALWSTHSIIDQPWGRHTCQSAAGGPRSLLYSSVFVLRCVSIVVYIGLDFWPLTSTSRISCLSVGLSCGLVVLTEAEWRPCSLRRNRSHGLLSAVGRS